jgi:hypothetical protein
MENMGLNKKKKKKDVKRYQYLAEQLQAPKQQKGD